MLRRFRPRMTFANVTSLIALFIALGGGAYAATSLPSNSVGPKQLKDKAVTPPKVAPKTIKLFKGQRGAPGATHVTARTKDGTIQGTCTSPAPPFYACTGTGTVTAPCNQGERATGGSFAASSVGSLTPSDTGPSPSSGTPTGWFVTGSYSTYTPTQYTSYPVTVHVVCAAP